MAPLVHPLPRQVHRLWGAGIIPLQLAQSHVNKHGADLVRPTSPSVLSQSTLHVKHKHEILPRMPRVLGVSFINGLPVMMHILNKKDVYNVVVSWFFK